MKSKKKNNGIWMDIAVLIVCFAIATSSLASGVFAKFTSAAKSEGGNSRAAAFTVDAKLNATQYAVDLTEGEGKGIYTLALTNDSETAVACTVVIKFEEPVADFVNAQIIGRAGAVSGGAEFVFENIEFLEAGENASLTIELTVDPARYTAEQTSTDYDFTVNVTFDQID